MTITARSVNGQLQPKFADNLEIWVDDRTAPVLTRDGVIGATARVGPFEGSQFSYGCRVRAGDEAAFTGWRTVGVGPQPGSAAPVLITGPTSSRLDVVFVAERDDYTDATDPAFRRDVIDAIDEAFYARAPFDPAGPGSSTTA